MPAEMTAINLTNATSQVKSSNNSTSKSNQSSKSTSKQDNFLSSLQAKQNNVRKKDSNKSNLKNERTKNKSKGEIEIKISDKKLKELKELIKKNPEKLNSKDLEALLSNLSTILQQFSQRLKAGKINPEKIQKLVDSLSANGEQLQNVLGKLNANQNTDLQNIMKNLATIQEQLLAQQEEMMKQLKDKSLQNNFKNSLNRLEELVKKTNAEVVQSSTEKNNENLANKKLLNRFNLAKEPQNKGQEDAKQSKKNESASLNLKELIKQEGVGSQSSKAEEKTIDLKGTIKTNNSNVDLNNLNNIKLGQLNTDTKNFSQAITKESMATKTVDLQNVINQLDNKLDFTAVKRGNKITMQLEPEFLGKIQMKVGVEDGSVTAKILAESNQVKELLNGNLTKLKASLEQKGIEIDQFDVSVGYQEEELAQQNNPQQEFLFKQQQEKNTLNKFSLQSEEGELISETVNNEESIEVADDVDYMA